MKRFPLRTVAALAIALPIQFMYATSPSIGVAVSNGNLNIDNAKVAGNATLFEGNSIQTGKASSDLKLNSGARIRLALESQGIVHRDHVVLEKGGLQLDAPSQYRVDVRALSISPSSPN